ncbi:hypothetical protein, partial [Streptomyces stelliscabiei]|uniref:hypothetical protein n=1 Tax=Streptomyces stelliscabiei TaxID=146820 RepID=UPI00131E7871
MPQIVHASAGATTRPAAAHRRLFARATARTDDIVPTATPHTRAVADMGPRSGTHDLALPTAAVSSTHL